MIKFFRKIRQNLLMENKTGKYFKYAIGEIVLVVLGILIALSINNWNENKKDRRNETVFLQGIINDIDEQRLVLEDQVDAETRRVTAAIEALRIIDNDSIQFKLDSVYGRIKVLSIRKTFSVFNPTYEELKSTGSLKLIKDDTIKKSIILFYQNLEHINLIITANNSSIDNIYKPYILNNSLGFFRNKDNTLMIHWKDKPTQLYQLMIMVNECLNFHNTNRTRANTSIDELDQLKSQLIHYLETK